MSYVFYNPNPQDKIVGDCVIRAISKAMGYDWERTYTELCLQGFMMSDLPSSNAVWGTYLINKGFIEYPIQKSCKNCYNLMDFCKDHPVGIFVVGTDFHATCVYMGSIYDTYDCGNLIPTYYFEKEEDSNG